MSRIIHLSDLHFGKDRPDLLVPLLEKVNGYSADLVAISGDMTQRARAREYRAARAFIDRIDAPVLCVPGNHDIPIHRPLSRLAKPWAYYKRWIADDLAPAYFSDDMVVAGLNSVDRFSWQTGRMSSRRLRRACNNLSKGAPGALRIIVTHHPLEHPYETTKKPIPRAARALDRLLDCGADMILSGHLHIWHAGVFAHVTASANDHKAIQVHAGTSLSSRVRGEPNDFNLIDIDAAEVRIDRISFDEDSREFKKKETRPFSRVS